MKQTKIDIIFSKLSRDLGRSFDNDEVIEWAGDALGLLWVSPMLSERVCIGEVRNFKMCLPPNFLFVRMIARHAHSYTFNHWWRNEMTIECNDDGDEATVSWSTYLFPDSGYDYTTATFVDEIFPHGSFISIKALANHWRAVRLSEHAFFNTLTYPFKEGNKHHRVRGLYDSNIPEYRIVEDVERTLQFNFERGLVAIAYLATAIDSATGYPLIPDDQRTIEAISYYIKWKIFQREMLSGSHAEFRINQAKSQDMERSWLQHLRAAKTNAVMPKTIDEYQNIMHDWAGIMPNYYRYYTYFGRRIINE